KETIDKAYKRYASFDKKSEGCQVIDPEFRYLYLNDTTVTQSRKTKEELLGKSMMESYPGIEKGELFIKIKKCLETKTMQKMENKFTYPDGKIGYFDLKFQPVEEGVFIFSVDVSEGMAAMDKIRT
ncbi:MAG: PAS domain-containing protein, partial [Candidatus Dojkabacteria bacterium]